VKTSQWFGHQCWTELRRTSYCLGQIAKILVTGSQRQENLITSMGLLYVHGTWMSHIVTFHIVLDSYLSRLGRWTNLVHPDV
jgi:hypothetical protein